MIEIECNFLPLDAILLSSDSELLRIGGVVYEMLFKPIYRALVSIIKDLYDILQGGGPKSGRVCKVKVLKNY